MKFDLKKLPNLLSNLRVVMIPFFVWQMLVGHNLAAGGILALSGVTDVMDGKLARKLDAVSDVGKALDPLADKMTQCAVSICLILRYPFLWYLFLVLIVKDLVMVALGVYIYRNGIMIDGAGIFGKVATVLFYVSMGLLILLPNIPQNIVRWMVAVNVFCAMLAGMSYLPDLRRYLMKKREAGK